MSRPKMWSEINADAIRGGRGIFISETDAAKTRVTLPLTEVLTSNGLLHPELSSGHAQEKHRTILVFLLLAFLLLLLRLSCAMRSTHLVSQKAVDGK